ncbi:unnamed protein product [Symbiodinium sp. CCMP2592]|nr:unnamed protein product [Symbiodinium sp. CCMP2592]
MMLRRILRAGQWGLVLLWCGIFPAGSQPLVSKTVELKEHLPMPLLSLGLTAGQGVGLLLAFLAAGGRHISVRSSSSFDELQEIAGTVADAGISWSEVFVMLQIVNEDLGYDGTVMAVDRIMGGLGIASISLALVGAGRAGTESGKGKSDIFSFDPSCARSDFGWELCIAGSLAAVEHMKYMGTVQAFGAHDWSVRWLQRFWPLLHEPLSAMLLTFDTLATSHRASVKYCLMRGVQVIMGGFVERPGRLLLYMFFDAQTHLEASAGLAANAATTTMVDWLTAMRVAVVLPSNVDRGVLADFLLSDDRPVMKGPLIDTLEFAFWPVETVPLLHEILPEGTGCPPELQVTGLLECKLAMKDLHMPADVHTTQTGSKGCSLQLEESCSSSACAQPRYRADGEVAVTSRSLPVCQINAAKLPEQGRTLFLSMCMGPEYFDKFCAPFLASFQVAYGRAPAGWHKLKVWSVGVNKSQLERASDLFSSSGVEFEESSLDEMSRRYAAEHAEGSGVEGYLHEDLQANGVDGATGCFECDLADSAECHCDPGVHDEKVIFNNIYFLRWVVAQFEATRDSGFQYMVFLDSDMLFLQPLDQFLPRWPASEWEYAFTVYDKHHEVPWGTNEEVAQTRNGFVRFNAGVQFFRYTPGVLLYLRNLVRITLDFVEQGHVQFADENPLTWYLEEFKGVSQAAIAWAVGLDYVLYEDCQICRPKIQPLQLMSEYGEPFELKIQGLPARQLNQAESVEDGVLTEDTYIVHLKGLWWRILILNSTAHPIPTRCLAWNSDAHKLWTSLYLVWRPEHVIDTIIRNGEGCPATSWLDRPEEQLGAVSRSSSVNDWGMG